MKVTKITVLDQSEVEIPGPEGKAQVATYLTVKSEEGRIDLIVVKKKDPTDADIVAAYKEQIEKAPAKELKEITL